MQDNVRYFQTVGNLLAQHLQNIPRGHTEELTNRFAELQAILNAAIASSPQAFQLAREYVLDASQRWVLYVDALRQRGNAYLAHEAAGCPPVLAYDFEVIVDGRQLARPVGSPLSYWAGARGKNPLRYMGGLFGGALPALIISDLGAGKFDGAHLVLNFEGLNPAATWWRKYYDLYSKADTEIPRFLEFERWWSGFYFMNAAEIRWILEDLFIGNKLPRGRARCDDGGAIDLRKIRSPIIVFASEGDNITPPPQALNWIADLYSDVRQIKLRGQRILYTLHSAIGHLGIFVSAKIAQKEHKEIGSTLKSIEALPPGLYELVITEKTSDGASPRYSVSFEERTIADLVVLYDNGREDEQQF